MIQDPFKAQRDVDFFLRLHRHLPDEHCGSAFPFGPCNYRPDGEPINGENQPLAELQRDSAFVAKEKEVADAVGAKWKDWGRI